MDRVRYEGYVSARDAVAMQPLDPRAAEVVDELAEALLLARDASEAHAAREAVPEALGALVDRHAITRRTADRFWVHLKACGPTMEWPPSWDGASVSASRGAASGR
jgi:hypothetical protein